MEIMIMLATWRLSSLFSKERGPYSIFEKIRYILGVRYDKNSEPYGKTEFGKMILCTWCNSVWIGGFFAALEVVFGYIQYTHVVPYVFAYSAGAIVVDEFLSLLMSKNHC